MKDFLEIIEMLFVVAGTGVALAIGLMACIIAVLGPPAFLVWLIFF